MRLRGVPRPFPGLSRPPVPSPGAAGLPAGHRPQPDLDARAVAAPPRVADRRLLRAPGRCDPRRVRPDLGCGCMTAYDTEEYNGSARSRRTSCHDAERRIAVVGD